MHRTVIVLIFCVTSRLLGAFEPQMPGGRSVALGGGGVAAPLDTWSAFTNPGTLATLPSRSLALMYAPQQFGLPELARGAFSYVEPTGIGTFALSGTRFGFTLYREVEFRLSFGTPITPAFSVGASVDYYHLTIEHYGSASTFGLDVGMVLSVTDEVRWGFAAMNINAPTLGEEKEKLPQVFSTGVSYQPFPEAAIVIDIVKELQFPAELRVGVEYTVLDLIALRGGTSSDPSLLCAGVGLHYSLLQLDYAFTNHVDLGATHQVSLSVDLGGI